MTLTIFNVLLYIFALIGVFGLAFFALVWYLLAQVADILIPFIDGATAAVKRKY